MLFQEQAPRRFSYPGRVRILTWGADLLRMAKLSKNDRAAAMAKVRQGAGLTIGTTHLLGEGVDVPGWDLLFLVTPMAGEPRVLQAVGRVARPVPERRAVVVDLVDDRVEILRKAFRKRRQLCSQGEVCA